MVVFLQRDQNIRIARTDQPRRGVLSIQRAVRQADVVENVVHLGGGTVLRISCSTRSHSLAVSSIRVPLLRANDAG